jgi:hypothetical protein
MSLRYQQDTIDPIYGSGQIGAAPGLVKDWKTATHAYYFDQYRFRGFEALHAYNIIGLERELCKYEVDLVTNCSAGQLPFRAVMDNVALDESRMAELRKLLHLHGLSSV